MVREPWSRENRLVSLAACSESRQVFSSSSIIERDFRDFSVRSREEMGFGDLRFRDLRIEDMGIGD